MRHVRAFYPKDAVEPCGDAHLYIELGAVGSALDRNQTVRDNSANEWTFKAMREELGGASPVTRRDFKRGWDEAIQYIKDNL
jgi:hypothetical protein